MVSLAKTFLLCQIWIIKYSVKYSTVDCKYLLFLQDCFFFKFKPKQYKKCQYCRLFKKIWKLIKQNKLFDGIFDIIFDIIFDDPYLTE